MSKRAFMVLGGESTGTRLVTRLLLAAGCYGDGDHVQRLDTHIPEDKPLLVWRRSVPHANEMPNIAEMALALVRAGYVVTAVITVRDWLCTAQSQVKAPHAPNDAAALYSLQNAYRHIFAELPAFVPYIMVNYESLALQPERGAANLYSLLNLTPETAVYIYNGNEKYA